MDVCTYIQYVIGHKHVSYAISMCALVRSEFTVLMACGKKLCFSLSVLAE